MDRMWQWLWDRYGRHYSWAIIVAVVPMQVCAYLVFALMIVAFEHSARYGEAASCVVVAAAIYQTATIQLGRRWLRPAELWAAGREVDRAAALEGTYTYTRKALIRLIWGTPAWGAAMYVSVGVIAGGSGWRLVQYGILGALLGESVVLATAQGIMEAVFRPVRVALAGDSDIGDAMPRSRPTFAMHANVSAVALIFAFTITGTLVVAVYPQLREQPVLCAVAAGAITLLYGVPFAIGNGLSPRLRPISDLAQGADRVAVGDFSRRLPVAQDDDLGALVGSFNRMQAGLAERQRLQAAFGAYVDPALAARLLQQGDDIFTGERREVTVMFVDVRDFTSFAEANSAEDTVAHLNALFEIVVPAVVDAGGHINKFLGDGALAVFGAPNHLPDHADAAVAAAASIHRLVLERFRGDVRIGIGINTGEVIAGTIGAAGHLEFGLIGDTMNVAARVEQLTKTTGDTILLTGQCVDAMATHPGGLTDRGSHALKGKAASTRVFGLVLAAHG